MNSGLNPANPIIVAAFRSALFQQWAVVAAIFALLLLCWGATRGWVTARTQAKPGPAALWREPKARRLLRVGFGVLWLFDGILQAQPQMAGGLPSQVIGPAGADSPGWVQHLVSWGATVWSNHPIQAGAASVWIQAGIGMWLIFGDSGWSSRLAGVASAAWGLIVWVFAEAFGEIFAPGQTVLFGAPGAVLFYVLAGALIALPERAWRTALTGRLLLGGIGVFFAGMALLQAWPGRGFWQGTLHGKPAPLADMIQSMAGIQQPHVLSVVVSWFGNFTAAHGFAVNLAAVAALAALGAVFCAAAQRADTRLAGFGVLAAGVFCLADWVLIEDFGFFGGLGTDPNSMVPLILLFAAGYQALTPAPRPEVVAEAVGDIGAVGAGGVTSGVTAASGAGAVSGAGAASGAGKILPRVTALRDFVAALSGRSVAALGAVGVIVVGAAPMAFASVNKNADPIIAQALAGSSGPLDTPAPGFTLTSQAGRQVSLASLRGKVVLLTFLDPVCTTDCPLIAQEMRDADSRLGARASGVELVAVVANPTYLSTAFTAAFTRQEGLDQVPNWLYLTGPLNSLQAVWKNYGIEVQNLPAGAMSAHNDVAYVISAAGRIRQAISDDPGPGTSTTLSSFAGLLADSMLATMGKQQ